MAKKKQPGVERVDIEPLDDGVKNQYLSFCVNGVTYGVEIRRVLQICRELTKCPKCLRP